MLAVCTSQQSGRRLHVLDISLDTMYAWPQEESGYPGAVNLRWTPSCILMALVRLHAWPDDPAAPSMQWHLLEVCCHPQPHPMCSPEAILTWKLLAEVAPQQPNIREVAYSPTGGLAVVIDPDNLHVFHIQLVVKELLESPLVCVPVRRNLCQDLLWSPAGDRLLLHDSERIQLLTSVCSVILDMPSGGHVPVFSPDGLCLALAYQLAIEAKWQLRLYNTCDGALIFQHAWDGHLAIQSSLTFSREGDQIVVSGQDSTHVVSFGQELQASSWSSRQLCEAIAGACCKTAAIIWEGW